MHVGWAPGRGGGAARAALRVGGPQAHCLEGGQRHHVAASRWGQRPALQGREGWAERGRLYLAERHTAPARAQRQQGRAVQAGRLARHGTTQQALRHSCNRCQHSGTPGTRPPPRTLTAPPVETTTGATGGRPTGACGERSSVGAPTAPGSTHRSMTSPVARAREGLVSSWLLTTAWVSRRPRPVEGGEQIKGGRGRCELGSRVTAAAAAVLAAPQLVPCRA